MNKSTYRIIGKFECCGKAMVTVIIKSKAACTMTEREFDRLLWAEKQEDKEN